mmetsp:Transcript_35088/g.76705  ORF Transcript_35088/g.76705 Transcript_35088/m.76705 type:complete len:215 (+) Transcript_35088:639-1283(+)
MSVLTPSSLMKNVGSHPCSTKNPKPMHECTHMSAATCTAIGPGGRSAEGASVMSWGTYSTYVSRCEHSLLSASHTSTFVTRRRRIHDTTAFATTASTMPRAPNDVNASGQPPMCTIMGVRYSPITVPMLKAEYTMEVVRARCSGGTSFVRVAAVEGSAAADATPMMTRRARKATSGLGVWRARGASMVAALHSSSAGISTGMPPNRSARYPAGI